MAYRFFSSTDEVNWDFVAFGVFALTTAQLALVAIALM